MNCINVFDHAIDINGHLLEFPISYEELKAELGEARLDVDPTRGVHTQYMYDDLGIAFEGSEAYIPNLKQKKAFKDREHTIIGLTLHVTDTDRFFEHSSKPSSRYCGNLLFNGEKIKEDIMWPSAGCLGYVYRIWDKKGKEILDHVFAFIDKGDVTTNYDGDRYLRDTILTFKPERPKSQENYNIEIPDEECLQFDTFNFKLAVINELMYKQEVLKPYFDIYDYMAFKKAHWNLETIRNVRAAVKFFEELPIPVRLADYVKEIKMDGADDIYMNIAPEWDGEDSRFDVPKMTAKELSQFKNLKYMEVFASESEIAKLKKICEPLGIDVEHI